MYMGLIEGKPHTTTTITTTTTINITTTITTTITTSSCSSSSSNSHSSMTSLNSDRILEEKCLEDRTDVKKILQCITWKQVVSM